jgi:hypothetical protein
LDCPGVERNMDEPRSSVYSKDLFEKIMDADRITFNDGSVSYGKLPVSYCFVKLCYFVHKLSYSAVQLCYATV